MNINNETDTNTNNVRIQIIIAINTIAAFVVSIVQAIIVGGATNKNVGGGFSSLIYTLSGIVTALIAGITNAIVFIKYKKAALLVVMALIQPILFILITNILEKIPFFSRLIP